MAALLAGLLQTTPVVEQEPPPSQVLSVTGLPLLSNEDVVKQIFGAGVLHAKVLPRAALGDVMALIQFSSIEQAKLIRENYDGSTINDPRFPNPLKIRYVAPTPGFGVGTPAGYGLAGVAIPPKIGHGAAPYEEKKSTTNLYVKGLPPGVNEIWIRDSFAEHGARVTMCKVLQSEGAGVPWRALVRFDTAEEAKKVVDTFTGAQVQGEDKQSYTIQIDYAMAQHDRPPRAPSQTPQEIAAAKALADRADLARRKAEVAAAKAKAAAKAALKGKGKGKFEEQTTLTAEEVVKAMEDSGCLPGLDLSPEDNCMHVKGLPVDADETRMYKLLAPFGPITASGLRVQKDEFGNCTGDCFVNYVNPASIELAALQLNGKKFKDGTVLKAGAKGKVE